MVLYDVILVGFPEGPKIGGSEAEALSTVFGIPKELAERMVAQVPAIVKSGVTEEVCRKYFNAFVYMGARCHFLLTGEFAEGELPGDGDSTAGGSLRLASKGVLAVAPEDQTEDEDQSAVRSAADTESDSGSRSRSLSLSLLSGDRKSFSDSRSRSGSESDFVTGTLPEDDFEGLRLEQPGSRTESGPRAEVAAAGSIPPASRQPNEPPEDLIPATADTSRALPHKLLRSLTHNQPEATEQNETPRLESGSGPALRGQVPSDSAAAFDMALFAEMTPPDLADWRPEALELLASPSDDSEQSTASQRDSALDPPKASIVDDDPAIGGTRDALPSVSSLEEHSWRPASDSAPADFLERAATTGEPAVAGFAMIPRETTGVPSGPSATGPGSAEGNPSVAEIRAAWQAGKDIPLGPGLEGDNAGSSLGDWDPWLDSELPDADFPSGVAVTESQEAPSVDIRDGTQLQAPATSRLMAHLEAQNRARELAAESAGPTPTTPVEGGPDTGDAPAADSNAPLFGAPLGARAVSQSGVWPSRRVASGSLCKDEPVESKEDVDCPEPTEVPMAAMNFVKLRKKRGGDDKKE